MKVNKKALIISIVLIIDAAIVFGLAYVNKKEYANVDEPNTAATLTSNEDEPDTAATLTSNEDEPDTAATLTSNEDEPDTAVTLTSDVDEADTSVTLTPEDDDYYGILATNRVKENPPQSTGSQEEENEAENENAGTNGSAALEQSSETTD